MNDSRARKMAKTLALQSLLHDQHAAMGVVADAVGGVAQQAAPQLRMVAVPHHDQVAAPFRGELEDALGRVPAPRLTSDLAV